MTTASLAKTTAPADADRVDISHIRSTVEDLDALRSRMTAMKEEEKALLAVVRAALGSHHIGTIAGEDAVRADERTNSSLDREAVKTLLGPEVYGTVLRLTPYVAVSVVGKFKRGKR